MEKDGMENFKNKITTMNFYMIKNGKEKDMMKMVMLYMK